MTSSFWTPGDVCAGWEWPAILIASGKQLIPLFDTLPFLKNSPQSIINVVKFHVELLKTILPAPNKIAFVNFDHHCLVLSLCSEFPNCTAKVKGERQVLVGHDILEAKDVSSLALRRPVDRGYVTAWDVQREIWVRALRRLLPNLQPSGSGLVLTEPYLNLPALREASLQVIFQELGFAAVALVPPAVLSLRWLAATADANPNAPFALAAAAGCGLVIDMGFSYTHAVPVFDWRVIPSGIRRIDLGGKALTNYMKELVSYRSINMMDESYLLEHIKNTLCFVSQNTTSDLAAARRRDSPFRKEWLLPDGVTSTWGHLRDPGEPRGPKDPILVVNNERFMVPEALFHPSDIGMDQAGLAETIATAVKACHPHLQGLLYSNIVLTGGMGKCPGLKERLEKELRPLIPDDYDLNLTLVDEPERAAWKGGVLLGRDHAEFRARAVTRAEWQQYGAAACGKFDA